MADKTKNLSKCVFHSIRDAHKDYKDLSNGDWLWTGAEYFLTVSIAKSLKRTLAKTGAGVAIEKSLSDEIFSWKRGRPSDWGRFGGRVDCVAYDSNDTPLAVVEVKSEVHHTTCEADMDRLISLLLRSKKKYPAIFAYYASESGPRCEDWLERRAKNLVKLAEFCIGFQKMPKDIRIKQNAEYRVYRDDGDAYLAFSLTFEVENK